MLALQNKLLNIGAALAIAAGVSLGTAPAQAFFVEYIGCVSDFCTLEELFSGASITVDENMDGSIDKIFSDWQLGDMVNIPLNDIEVRAFDAGTLNVGLDYKVLNDALTLNPTGTNLETLGLPYSFKVKAIHPIRLTDNELQLTQATTEGGVVAAVSIIETINSPNGEELGMKMVAQNSQGLMELDDIS